MIRRARRNRFDVEVEFLPPPHFRHMNDWEAFNENLYPNCSNWKNWEVVIDAMLVERNKLQGNPQGAAPKDDWNAAIETIISLRNRYNESHHENPATNRTTPENEDFNWNFYLNNVRDQPRTTAEFAKQFNQSRRQWGVILQFLDDEKGGFELTKEENLQWDAAVNALNSLRNRSNGFSLRNMCRIVILQTTEGDSIDKLPLPKPVLDYLKF